MILSARARTSSAGRPSVSAISSTLTRAKSIPAIGRSSGARRDEAALIASG